MRLASGVRVVALFEAAKGVIVLLAGFGLLTILHRHARSAAEAIVGRWHFNLADGYGHVFVRLADNFSDKQLWVIAVAACVYALARFTEAYGLWYGRRWAEWFAVASGGVYVPFEMYELSGGVSSIKLGALLINIVVVAYMAYALWRSKQDEAAVAGTRKTSRS